MRTEDVGTERADRRVPPGDPNNQIVTSGFLLPLMEAHHFLTQHNSLSRNAGLTIGSRNEDRSMALWICFDQSVPKGIADTPCEMDSRRLDSRPGRTVRVLRTTKT
jgi:hypothetical protein